MKVTKKISKYNYSSRGGSAVKYIVIHYVGSVSSAKNNAAYFAKGDRRASAHYFVDDISVYQSVEDKHAAWHCGGGSQGSGGKAFYGKCKNTNSIGIEMCCKKKNGKLYITDKTIKNTAEQVSRLMKKYGVPAGRVIRHYDVTGKSCPAPYLNSAKWNALHKTLTLTSAGKSPVTLAPPPVVTTKTAEDGKWGTDCTKKSQKVMGTFVDGEVSRQPKSNKKYLPNMYETSWEFKRIGCKGGSDLVKAIQRLVGESTDGFCGKKTIKGMQIFLRMQGLYTGAIDGSGGPKTVLGWQKYINKYL